MNFFECCHKCPKRYPGCHSTCKEFIIASKSAKAQNELIAKKKQEESQYISYIVQKIKKNS